MLKEVIFPLHRRYKSRTEWEPIGFFSEALCNATQFDIKLGFFSSSAINVLADGFAAFLYNGGRMRMVINDILSMDDKQAIMVGESKVTIPYFNLQNIQDFKKVYEEQGLLNYLLEQKKQGKIRNLGWSFHGDMEMFNYLLSLDVDWDFALIQINYLDWEVAPDISKRKWANENTVAPNAQWMYEKLTERGIPIIVMEPLLGGRLAKLNQEARTILKTANPEASAAQWAFRFVGQLPNVLTVLSGMTYMEHLVENARTYSPLQPLTERETTALNNAIEAQRGKHTINCTTCRYCMPCPYGIDIPAIFSHYNKCVAEDNIPPDAQDPDYARARRAYLVSYDRAMPDLRQADKCIACKRCNPLCPQMIDIPTEMLRIAKLVESLR